MSDETPIDPRDMAHLRYLRLLVTVLTATMIAGLIILIVLFVTRFPKQSAPLPAAITLPDGAKVVAFTQAPDWYAVVTAGDEILIFDRGTGALKQTIKITP